MSNSNEQLVTGFCQSLTQGPEGFERYLHEDVYYLNVPLPPLNGRKAALAFLQPFLDPPLMQRMEILHTTSSGAMVMNERLEHWVKDDLHVDLPVAGVFEVRDGRILTWKDYFDLPTVQPLLDAVMGH